MFGFDPGLTIRSKASSGNKHVDVRMKQHGAGPSVENGRSAEACAQIAGIGREQLESIGGGLHQKTVDFLRMGSCEWPKIGGQSEGHQKVGTRGKAAALFVNPALGL